MNDEPGIVCVALIVHSPWPDLERECDGAALGTGQHTDPRWVVWTSTDTGDGMRVACDRCLDDWVKSVAARLWDVYGE